MVTRKRPPITSPDEVMRIMAGAKKEIAPPSHVPLTDADWPFWHAILAEQAKAEWTEHQLEVVAMLARTMAHLEQAQRELVASGYTTHNAQGVVIAHPMVAVCKSIEGSIVNLRRSLGIHARSQVTNGDDAARRKELGREIEKQVSDGSLLA